MPPTPTEFTEYADGKDEALQAIKFIPSDAIKESGSKFYAYAAKVSSIDDVRLMYIKVALQELSADHTMMAYSFKAAGETHSGVSKDWEIGGGLTMKYFLDKGRCNNVAVCVPHYYGGLPLQNRRFQCITRVISQALCIMAPTKSDDGAGDQILSEEEYLSSEEGLAT